MRSSRLLFYLGLVVLLVSLMGCLPPGFGGAGVPPTDTPAPAPTDAAVSTGPRLRIKNVGEQDIKGLVVMFPDQRIEFGDIPAGATSVYMDAPKGVYNYAAYEYLLNGEKILQPVIDWVGESPRPGSDFTYSLELRPESANMLSMQLIEATVDR
jgi:hypothetical protein